MQSDLVAFWKTLVSKTMLLEKLISQITQLLTTLELTIQLNISQMLYHLCFVDYDCRFCLSKFLALACDAFGVLPPVSKLTNE